MVTMSCFQIRFIYKVYPLYVTYVDLYNFLDFVLNDRAKTLWRNRTDKSVKANSDQTNTLTVNGARFKSPISAVNLGNLQFC